MWEMEQHVLPLGPKSWVSIWGIEGPSYWQERPLNLDLVGLTERVNLSWRCSRRDLAPKVTFSTPHEGKTPSPHELCQISSQSEIRHMSPGTAITRPGVGKPPVAKHLHYIVSFPNPLVQNIWFCLNPLTLIWNDQMIWSVPHGGCCQGLDSRLRSSPIKARPFPRI